MSEYIGYKDPIGEGLFNMGLTDEEIVRCRDCNKARKDSFKCARFHEEDGAMADVKPMGYCAWGEKR